MTGELERKIIEVIATDRVDVPISSMSGKLKRRKPKLAKGVDLSNYDNYYEGGRVWARAEYSDKMKARGMKEGIEKFEESHPRYGKILREYIEEERVIRETHLTFGMQDGCKLTSQDYIGVMENLGFTPSTAERLYPELLDISRKLSRKRQEYERSVLIG